MDQEARSGAIRSCSQEVALDGSGHHVSGSNAHLFPPLCRLHFPRSLGRTGGGGGGGGTRCSRGEELQRDAKGNPPGGIPSEVGAGWASEEGAGREEGNPPFHHNPFVQDPRNPVCLTPEYGTKFQPLQILAM